MQAINNISSSVTPGKILVGKKDTYEHLLKYKNANGFHEAMQKLDTFTKQGGVDIQIDKLASGGGVISKVSSKGIKEVLGADARDIVKCMQSALKKLEGNVSTIIKTA